MDNAFKDLGKLSYADFSFKKDLEYIRPVLLISMLLYASFALMDYLVYPQYIVLFLTIRFLFVLPIFFIGYLCSFYKSFRYTYQYVLMSMLIVGGIGIIAMIFAIQEANYYYSGLYLVFSIAFFFFPVSGSTILSHIISIEPLGQASSQAEQPEQVCSLFSSCGMVTTPQKRSNIFNVSLFSGYCCVIISLRACVK